MNYEGVKAERRNGEVADTDIEKRVESKDDRRMGKKKWKEQETRARNKSKRQESRGGRRKAMDVLRASLQGKFGPRFEEAGGTFLTVDFPFSCTSTSPVRP